MNEQPHRRIRASDADRDQVTEQVRHAMTEGRLSLSEGEERLAAVYATTYQDELGAFTDDLPPSGPTPGADSEPADAGGAQPAGTEPIGFGKPCGPRLGFVPLLLVAALATLATGWALLGGGPLWPAILFGVIAVVGIKHRWYAYLRTRDGDGRSHLRWPSARGWGHRGWGHRGWPGHTSPGHTGLVSRCRR